jgi:hypothetical protein
MHFYQIPGTFILQHQTNRDSLDLMTNSCADAPTSLKVAEGLEQIRCLHYIILFTSSNGLKLKYLLNPFLCNSVFCYATLDDSMGLLLFLGTFPHIILNVLLSFLKWQQSHWTKVKGSIYYEESFISRYSYCIEAPVFELH